jgi:5-methyltetrahydrofolate--homocysteine methyltransferase
MKQQLAQAQGERLVSLFYKPDWEETKQRYLAWWAGEALGRCAMAVYAPLSNPPDVPPPPEPKDPAQRWTDMDYIRRANEHRHSHTFYGGEAFPCWHGGYPGHKSIAAFLGCPVRLGPDTGWLDPILTEPEPEVRLLHVPTEGRWWKFTLDLLRTAARESPGRSIPSIGAFGGVGDTLAALRGTERLLLDLVERPDWVRDAEQFLIDLWFGVYDTFYDIVHEAAGGSTCWFELWSPGRFYAVQNDFSYMISPRMFRDIFLPAIERQTRFLDHAVYHVDGPGSFAHVDALCELPRLRALQILPGAGKPSPLHYMDVLRKGQAKGRNLHITIEPGEVENALLSLSARGLFIQTWCATEGEARQLLKDAEKWSHD